MLRGSSVGETAVKTTQKRGPVAGKSAPDPRCSTRGQGVHVARVGQVAGRNVTGAPGEATVQNVVDGAAGRGQRGGVQRDLVRHVRRIGRPRDAGGRGAVNGPGGCGYVQQGVAEATGHVCVERRKKKNLIYFLNGLGSPNSTHVPV